MLDSPRLGRNQKDSIWLILQEPKNFESHWFRTIGRLCVWNSPVSQDRRSRRRINISRASTVRSRIARDGTSKNAIPHLEPDTATRGVGLRDSLPENGESLRFSTHAGAANPSRFHERSCCFWPLRDGFRSLEICAPSTRFLFFFVL